MADRPRMTADQLVDKLLASEHADVLRESIAWLVAELMDAEVATLVGAELGERAPDRRTTQRNGYRVGCRNPFMQLVGSTRGADRRAGLAGAHGAGSR